MRILTVFTVLVSFLCNQALSEEHNFDIEKQPGYVLGEFIYETAPYPSCHASTIEETPEGLIAAWFGGTHERHPDVGIWVAHKKDGEWTESVEVANGVISESERHPTWNPVLFQPKSGPLMLFYKVGPTPRDWWGMLTSSNDNGESWTQPKRLPDGILGPIKNKPIQLPDGEILCPTSDENNELGWRVYFESTSDLGKTFNKTPYLNDGNEIRAIQPSILLHGNNKLQALGRTKSSRIFEIWSEDGGKTWGELTLTDLPNPNSGTDAVTLADGRHLLVYNHNPNNKGRTPLNVAVSEDGINWEAALILEHFEESTKNQYSYPAVIQTEDGLVHFTYTWRRERIKHVVIDPAKLITKPIVDGQWPANFPETH